MIKTDQMPHTGDLGWITEYRVTWSTWRVLGEADNTLIKTSGFISQDHIDRWVRKMAVTGVAVVISAVEERHVGPWRPVVSDVR
jgi:hypothetical protein